MSQITITVNGKVCNMFFHIFSNFHIIYFTFNINCLTFTIRTLKSDFWHYFLIMSYSLIIYTFFK